MNYSKALQRLEGISDEIHEKRKIHSYLETRGVGVGAESPISSSPKLIKAFRKLSLDSVPQFSQINPLPWFYHRSSSNKVEMVNISSTNSEKDECESVTDSIDTLDDNVIDNLMLERSLESEFRDIIIGNNDGLENNNFNRINCD